MQLYHLPWYDIGKKVRFRKRTFTEQWVPERRPNTGQRQNQPTLHGAVSQIPQRYCHLPIISAIRPPCEKYASIYHYKDWQQQDQLPASQAEIEREFPDFPNLSFDRFLSYVEKHYGRARLVVDGNAYSIGPLTFDFLTLFTWSDFSNRRLTFTSWTALQTQLARTNFLQSKSINHDLHTFLLRRGFAERDINFILTKKPSNVSPNKETANGATMSNNVVIGSEWLLDIYSRERTPPSIEQIKHCAVLHRL